MTGRVKDILTRVWLIWFVLALALFLAQGHKKDITAVRVFTVDHLMPSYDYYTVLTKSENPPLDLLKESAFYYKKVTETFPNEKGPGEHFLGYFLYRLGDKKKAIEAIDRSIRDLPVFFWSQYNRGVYYFNEKDYLSAAKAFDAAASLDMRLTVMVLLKSKVCLQIIVRSSTQTKENNPSGSLFKGYEDARKYCFFSAHCYKNPGTPACGEKLQMKYF